MGIRLIIEGNAAYEIDEDCLACRQKSQDGVSTETFRENQRQNEDFSDCPE
ncbi:MAG: hypothetical protein KH353_10775 [Clostridium sp.]|jgi:hypothetical protein|nr:hypothetical protein [Clostridium sp.]